MTLTRLCLILLMLGCCVQAFELVDETTRRERLEQSQVNQRKGTKLLERVGGSDTLTKLLQQVLEGRKGEAVHCTPPRTGEAWSASLDAKKVVIRSGRWAAHYEENKQTLLLVFENGEEYMPCFLFNIKGEQLEFVSAGLRQIELTLS